MLVAIYLVHTSLAETHTPSSSFATVNKYKRPVHKQATPPLYLRLEMSGCWEILKEISGRKAGMWAEIMC